MKGACSLLEYCEPTHLPKHQVACKLIITMSEYKNLSEYGVIGNTHSAALISKDASIDWLCLPRFDSPSVFASILDTKRGGHFQIKPTNGFSSTFEYQEDTNILITNFKTTTGEVRVIDFMPVHIDPDGKFHVHDELHRIVEGVKGEVELDIIFEPKLEYAFGKTKIEKNEFGVIANNGDSKLSLSKDIPETKFKIIRGKRATFVLSWNNDPQPISEFDSGKRLAETNNYWKGVAEKMEYDGQWKSEVKRSFLLLHLLFYSPSGALLAAATTSLPEKIGGPRNWDYRFSWPRDSAFTLQALFALGDYDEALEYFSWLADVCIECGINMEVLYGIDKKSNLAEKELKHLEGYKKSSPVRIGNAAEKQLQLDIFGEVLNAAYIFHQKGGEITDKIWKLLESLADAASENWQKADQGFWESRSKAQHHLSAKLFSWVAMDRGIKIASERQFSPEKLSQWKKARSEIKSAVEKNLYNKKIGAFTQHYETEEMDATALLMPLVGFLPANDPRMLSTIEQISKKLEENNFIHRYLPEKTSDGLAGSEGAFLAVNFWLIQNFILLDRIDDARKMYERILKAASPLGVFSEMINPKTGAMLGNLPQALTHIEVILTAYYLDGSRL